MHQGVYCLLISSFDLRSAFVYIVCFVVFVVIRILANCLNIQLKCLILIVPFYSCALSVQ